MADKRMQYNQIVAKAWGNEMFKRKLLKDPAGTLREEGVELPKGVQVKIVEDSPAMMHFVLPVKPAGQVDAAVDFVVC